MSDYWESDLYATPPYLDDHQSDAERQSQQQVEDTHTPADGDLMEHYQYDFHHNFAESEHLNALWQQAVDGLGDHNYEAARREFWSIVNKDDGVHAQYVRDMLTAANYDLQGGTLAPILNLPTGAYDESRDTAYRQLSLDHQLAQRAPGGSEEDMNAANIRFMQNWDNSVRGNRHGPDDRPW